MRVLNFGSLNLDYVYTVDHISRPGETLAAAERSVKPGGKGLNQSVALARAGARVFHAGCVGAGGEALAECLAESGADIACLRSVPEAQGHAVIQVDRRGENSIFIYGGSNRCVSRTQVTETLARFGHGDCLLLQNEISLLPEIISQAHERGMLIFLNPSPYGPEIEKVDFGLLAFLLVNETEAEAVTGKSDPDRAWARLHAKYPSLSVLFTLGAAGSVCFRTDGTTVEKACAAAEKTRVADTTAAGDTYTGYFIEGLTRGLPLSECMARASRAAAVCVSRRGAAESIPRREEIDALL